MMPIIRLNIAMTYAFHWNIADSFISTIHYRDVSAFQYKKLNIKGKASWKGNRKI